MNPVKAIFVTLDTQFPAGTVAAGFLLTLQPAPAADGTQAPNVTATIALQSQDPADGAPTGQMVFTLPDVPVGSYIGSIALVDDSGAALAPAVTDPAPLNIANVQTVTFPVPTGLTLTRP